LNAVKLVSPRSHINVGRFVKSFDKAFDAELRERHGVHHRERFGDIQTSQIGVTRLMSLAGEEKALWKQIHNSAYRTASREWALRVKRRSFDLEETQKRIAGGIMECCAFLAARSEPR
jgi:hypothetical protein